MPYSMSKLETKICFYAFDASEGDYISQGILKFKNGQQNWALIIICSAIIWFLLTLFGTLSLIEFNINQSFGAQLALAVVALSFSGLLAGTSYQKFQKVNFCLMNRNDPVCHNIKTDCFEKNPTQGLTVANFGFFKFLEIQKVKGIWLLNVISHDNFMTFINF